MQQLKQKLHEALGHKGSRDSPSSQAELAQVVLGHSAFLAQNHQSTGEITGCCMHALQLNLP